MSIGILNLKLYGKFMNNTPRLYVAAALLAMYRFDLSPLLSLNSSPPSAAYMRQWIGSALVQIMACRLCGAKPLSKPTLGYCQLDRQEQTSVEFSVKNMHIKMSSARMVAILSRGRWVIGIDTKIEVIVVSPTTWEAHHSPRAQPEGAARGRSPRAQPEGAARGRSPRAQPEGAARGRSPRAQPEGAARGRSPRAQPEGEARGRSPRAVVSFPGRWWHYNDRNRGINFDSIMMP